MLTELLKEERKLNSLTKYGSILTYHQLGKKGGLIDELTESNIDDEEIIEGTEKVDGTNTRILISGKDYVIGTREDLIYAKGDRIHVSNDKLGFLDKMINLSEELIKNDFPDDELTVIYGENYGGRIGQHCKEYSKENKIGFRVFDVWTMKISDINEVMKKDLGSISSWRDHNNQPFYSIDKFEQFIEKYNLERTPVKFRIKKKDLPIDLKSAYEFLCNYKDSKVGLDVSGKAEGCVIRNNSRIYIKKLRFEDYEKTFRRMEKEK